MNQFVAIVTVLSLIAHAAVGCCAHSVHFAVCHAVSATHSEATHEASHSHPTDCEDPASPCDSTSGEEHECQHTKCQWLSSLTNIDITLGTPFNTDCVVCDLVLLQAGNSPSHGLAALSESPSEVPLRSHLALNVLLI